VFKQYVSRRIHFKVFRKIVDVGLKVAYGQDEDLKAWFKGCVALALLPPEKVGLVYAELVMDEAPIVQYPELVKFLDYMTDTWMDERRFPIPLWNHFHNDDSRTNNSNEAYNLRLDKRTEKHPNIWCFIELLQKEELHASVKFERIENNTLVIRGPKRVDMRRDLTISNAKNKYLQTEGHIDTFFRDFFYFLKKLMVLNKIC